MVPSPREPRIIVVLGCAVVGTRPSRALTYRLERALELWDELVADAGNNGEVDAAARSAEAGNASARSGAAVTHDDGALPLVVVCGGLGPGKRAYEADVMAAWLAERGIPEERIVRERDSTSTEQNLRYAAEILRERGLVPGSPNADTSARIPAYVVTSHTHLPRSLYWAWRAGFRPFGRGARVPEGTEARAIAWEVAAVLLTPPAKLYGYLQARLENRAERRARRRADKQGRALRRATKHELNDGTERPVGFE